MKTAKSTGISETAYAIVLLLLLCLPPFLGIMLMHLHGSPARLFYRSFSWFACGLLAGAFVMPHALRLLCRNPAGGEKEKTRQRLFLFLCLCPLAVLSLLIAWGKGFCSSYVPLGLPLAASFGLGALVPLGQMLFFAWVPPRWLGRAMAAFFIFLELFWLMLLPDLSGALNGGGTPSPEQLAFSLMSMRKALYVCLGMTLSLALVLWQRNSVLPDGLPEQGPRHPAWRSAFSPGALLFMAALCFCMNGLLGGGVSMEILYFLPGPSWAHALFVFLCLLAGLCMDKYGQQGARVLVSSCACVFLLMPVLLVTRQGTALHGLLLYAAYAAQHLLYMAMLLLLGRGPFEGRFPGLMCVSIHLLWGVAFLVSALAHGSGRPPVELLLFSAMLLAGGIIVTALGAPTAAPAVPARARPAAPPVSPEAFAEHHGLSTRDQEVLRLLLDGADAPALAEALGILPPEWEQGEATPAELAARYNLSPRMRNVLHLLLEGAGTREIAEALGIAPPPAKGMMTPEVFAERYNLTPRMREVLHLLLKGADTKTIAEALGVSPYTARLHVHHILRRTQLHSRKSILELVAKN